MGYQRLHHLSPSRVPPSARRPSPISDELADCAHHQICNASVRQQPGISCGIGARRVHTTREPRPGALPPSASIKGLSVAVRLALLRPLPKPSLSQAVSSPPLLSGTNGLAVIWRARGKMNVELWWSYLRIVAFEMRAHYLYMRRDR